MSTDYWKTFSLPWTEAKPLMVPLIMAGREQIDGWERLVHQVLGAQVKWSGDFTRRLRENGTLPGGVVSLAEQAQSTTEQLVQVQDQLWNGWFQWLRACTDGAPQAEGPPAPVEKSRTVAAATETLPANSVAVLEPAALEEVREINDLTALYGVGPAIAAKLYQAGVTSFAQIAGWTDADIEHVEETVLSGRFPGRIRRDDWVGEARRLVNADS
jgi:predicted flap endonuclease-1-like 5' DNA nuclease